MSAQSLGQYDQSVREAARSWQRSDATARLWASDASLWTGGNESAWLGWLEVASRSRARLPEWQAWADSLRSDGFRDVIVLGMGGSSLCPDVLSQTFGRPKGFPRLRVLDSTVPAQIASLAASIDLARSLFVVSSKSGTTIEVDALRSHFFTAAEATCGTPDAAARHFVAITDPNTPLEEFALGQGFRHIEHGVASIGGRFSALSAFGMLPAVLAGFDVSELLARAQRMADRCRAQSDDGANPGAELGIALATLARAGRDKLTFVTSPGLAAIGAWLEQLVAESTGKRGLGIVPIAEEAPGAPESYGDDRVFVYARLASDPSDEQDAAIAALEGAGQPILRLDIPDRLDLAAEFYRWEFAIAVAGSLLGLDPFDQPDVEAAKVAARELTDGFSASGALPSEAPRAELDGVAIYADPVFPTECGRDLTSALATHFARISPGDYFCVSAFVDMNERNLASLQRIREAVRAARRVATTLGFGPRFLHSTGQLHKGGPNSGVFLQITSDDAADIGIPGRDFSFGVLKQAQGLGDFQVLSDRGRRALRLHLGSNVEEELERVAAIAERAAQRSAREPGEETT
jgi:transaldolase/glucose-6-phosphate isomerase